MRRPILSLVVLASTLLVSACDQLGIESAAVTAEKRSAEGKAIGAACRHAGRAIEDCYTLNKKGEKAAIYTGWREMDDYMRENKLEPVIPVIPVETKKPKAPPPADPDAEPAKDEAAADEAPAKDSHGKSGH